MGKIVALGGGSFEYGEMWPLLRHIRSLCEKENPKWLFLPTASFDDPGDEGEALYLTDESLTYDEIRAKILGSDIVYVDGGNLKFLMDTWNKTGATEILREAYEKGIILSGLSSGAMCWFDWGWDDCLEGGVFTFVECVGLLPYCNCPHYESASWQNFKHEIKNLGSHDGLAIDNDVAVTFIDGKIANVLSVEEGKKAWLLPKEKAFVEEELK